MKKIYLLLIIVCVLSCASSDPYGNSSNINIEKNIQKTTKKENLFDNLKKIVKKDKSKENYKEIQIDKIKKDEKPKIETKKEVSKEIISEKTKIVPKTEISNEVRETTKTLKTEAKLEKITDTKKDSNSAIDEKFDATDERIVAFIDEKVYEDSAQIKKITVETLNKLLNDKKIRMTKREFLARTYKIIKENNLESFYLASARLLNEQK